MAMPHDHIFKVALQNVVSFDVQKIWIVCSAATQRTSIEFNMRNLFSCRRTSAEICANNVRAKKYEQMWTLLITVATQKANSTVCLIHKAVHIARDLVYAGATPQAVDEASSVEPPVLVF